MPGTSDYLPFANDPTANVETQAAYAVDPNRPTGVVNGPADPKQANKVWRQASVMMAAIGQFIVNQLQINLVDDGDQLALATLFAKSVQASGAGGLVETAVNYSVLGTETTIEVDATAGAVEIIYNPTVATNRPIRIVKVDATANAVQISDGISILYSIVTPIAGSVVTAKTAYSNGAVLRVIG